MQFKSTLLSLVVSSAFARASSNSSSVPSSCHLSSGATISSQADLNKYRGCTKLVGDLTIEGDLGSAILNGIQEIDGSLIVNNATHLDYITGDTITTITGSLILEDLTILTTASFSALESVKELKLLTLPAIGAFPNNLSSVDEVVISDTSLQSISGFSGLSHVAVFNINNNNYLTDVNLPLKTVSNALEVSFNGRNLAVVFNDLVWANNITISDVESVSFPNLEKVNSSLGFVNNSVSNLTVNSLSTVGGTFTITYNDDLTQLSFPNLTTVGGGFVIANNSDLTQINAFSNLASIGGALDAKGDFNTLDLSSLKIVKGSVDVETTSTNFSCIQLKKLHSKGMIQGDKFVCESKKSKSSSSSSTSSTSGPSFIGVTSSSTSGSSGTTTLSSATTSEGKHHEHHKSNAAALNIPHGSFFGAIVVVLAALI